MYIELAYPLDDSTPTFPGTPADRITPVTSMTRGDSFNTTKVEHYIHTGTHVDVPKHFERKGKSIEAVPVEDFVYSAPLLIDCPGKKGRLITPREIREEAEKTIHEGVPGLEECDIILLRTGYWKHRGNPSVYCDDFPGLSPEAALLLRTELPKLKAVAVDVLSVENPTAGKELDFTVHRTLLDSSLYPSPPLLVYEDVNLSVLGESLLKMVLALPVRFRGADGAPVNMVAEIEGGRG